MDKSNNENGKFNTVKIITRIVVILIVIAVFIYSDRSSVSSKYVNDKSNSSSSKNVGISAETIPLESAGNESNKPPSDSVSSNSASENVSSKVPDSNTQLSPQNLKLRVSNDRIHAGALILVDDMNKCNIDGHDYTEASGQIKSTYSLRNKDIIVNSVIIPHMNDMFDDFYKHTGSKQLTIVNGYISYDKQFKCYNGTDNSNYVMQLDNEIAKAGYSEHQTGYVIDLGIKTADGIKPYSPDGAYKWIADNCSRYGFITRYESDKEDITSTGYEPWHLRYVGLAHAAVMKLNNFCLEEYLNYVKNFSYEGQHLTITDADMNNWEIFYVPANYDDPDNETEIIIPQGVSYSISGNNTDGFIVTVKKIAA
ncbi:MAG: M15 family metallopeptidase [Acutalibacteraceae bacterium]